MEEAKGGNKERGERRQKMRIEKETKRCYII
jgi:hypothetical protein